MGPDPHVSHTLRTAVRPKNESRLPTRREVRMKRATTIACLTAMLAPAAALAQGTAAVPLDKATVSKEVAQRTLMKNQISAAMARQIVDACLDFARNQAGGPGNYAIFVLA